MTPQKCKQRVMRGYREYQCSGKEWKDGFCKQHHPDMIKARDEASTKAWHEKMQNKPEAKMAREIHRLTQEKAILMKALVDIRIGCSFPEHDVQLAIRDRAAEALSLIGIKEVTAE